MKENLLLKNTTFLRVWFANMLTDFGGIFFEVMIIWYLVSNRESALVVGGFIIISLVGELLGNALISQVVDFTDTKKLMASIDALRMILFIFSFLMIEHVMNHLLLLYGISLMVSFLDGSYLVTRRKSIPEIVSKENLVQANGLDGVAASLVRIGSWGLSAVLILTISLEATFLLNIGTALVALVIILSAKWASQKTLENADKVQFIEGIKIIRRYKNICQIIRAETIFFLLMGLFWVAFPFKAGAIGDGVTYALHGAIFGIGWLILSLFLSHRKSQSKTSLMYRLGIGAYAFGNVFVALASSPWVFLLGIFITGLGTAFWEAGKNTLFHLTVPTNEVGKVFSVFGTLTNGVMIPATIIGGFLLDRFDLLMVMGVIAGLQVIPMVMLGKVREG